MGNIVRLLPDDMVAVIAMDSFPTPEIFFELQRRGPVSADEMVRTFNCGLGMVVALESSVAEEALSLVTSLGIAASIVGEIRSGTKHVVLT